MHAPGLQERILDLDIDGFEIVNGGHPDLYANMFATLVMDRYPGRWAEMSGSDAHSIYTSGYNWTEFSGSTAEDFRRAVLSKSTIAVGKPAPVFGQVQWSVDVVLGGQKLLFQSLLGRLKNVPHDHLIEKINSITDLKKATAIFAGMLYVVPPLSFIATIASSPRMGMKARMAQIMIMTDGGPLDSTLTMSLYIYKQGVEYRDVGYSSAIAMVYTVIIAAVSLTLRKVLGGDNEA